MRATTPERPAAWAPLTIRLCGAECGRATTTDERRVSRRQVRDEPRLSGSGVGHPIGQYAYVVYRSQSAKTVANFPAYVLGQDQPPECDCGAE